MAGSPGAGGGGGDQVGGAPTAELASALSHAELGQSLPGAHC